ncbi:MAG: hypothetical protein KA251_07455 [Saprospiraceae bacterium]|nr:hypothetical protein [Candidatus Vicinibacter affinis]MBP6173590.1 hypothetical protein [Saprospiraceae bacterium]MBK6573930.1 hypothetical protein [Candidatus Vicinibacter affinis]MBK7302870.1 hypothetical protein [Candidatus Vicinibacter affinis]MBK7800127.1 hypothetical protein [Candidatus Vicinibacter affinis]
MPSSAKYLHVSWLLLLIIFSCTESEEITFTSYSSHTNDELTGIYFWNSGEGFVVGGSTWNRAIRLSTNDGGLTWQNDSLFDKQIFGLGYNNRGKVFGLGIEYMVYEFLQQSTSRQRIGDYRFFRSLDFAQPDRILAVGGESFGLGYLEEINALTGQTKQILKIDHELDAIQAVDENRWVIAGYGVVFYSEDAGMQWDTLDVSGDHYRDVFFVDEQTGFIVGIQGSILRSDDGGKNWKKLRNPRSIFIKDRSFRTICFKNKLEGLVGGEGGILWKTNDGGENWTILEGIPNVSYLDIFYDGNKYWICGSKGTIISIP